MFAQDWCSSVVAGPMTENLSYDVVIATRNRVDALALSIPMLLDQSRPPEALIVVDASDDPEPVRQVVTHATDGWPGRVVFETTSPGLPHQRNRGLRHVTSPIVFFPDDDSLLCDGAAAAMMDIYERDLDCVISGVCAAEALTEPPGIVPEESYAMTRSHRREALWRPLRHAVERRLTALKPALYLGRQLNRRYGIPAWLSEVDAVPVEYMTGFRMTFRTAAIAVPGFDVALDGYALDEDIDASFTAMRSGLVVGARRARIYHHRAPGGRDGTRARGRMEVMNRAYVLLKHANGPQGSVRLFRAIRWRQRLFVAIKLMHCLLAVGRAGGRARLAGVLTGRRQAALLWRRGRTDAIRHCPGPAQAAPHLSQTRMVPGPSN